MEYNRLGSTSLVALQYILTFSSILLIITSVLALIGHCLSDFEWKTFLVLMSLLGVAVSCMLLSMQRIFFQHQRRIALLALSVFTLFIIGIS